MRQSKYTKELLESAVSGSRSIADVLRKLGIRPTGGNYRLITSRLRLLDISVTHLRGQGWSQGRNEETDPAVARSTVGRRRPDEEVFVVNSAESCGHRLVRRLRRLGRTYACQACGLTHWNGRPLRLHLDHVNGVANDNRLDNLRFLCPNCHSQTETYCKRRGS